MKTMKESVKIADVTAENQNGYHQNKGLSQLTGHLELEHVRNKPGEGYKEAISE
jgi:hypothetical protein